MITNNKTFNIHHFIKILQTILFFFIFTTNSFSQIFWTEDFNNGCTSNCLASAFIGTNGSWTVTLTGTNGTDPNLWYVSCAENGHTNGICGTGCVPLSTTATLATLHIGSFATSMGDAGAAYDAGGLCGIMTCPETNQRAESPVVNCTGKSNITLSFDYIEEGDGTNDDATLWYFDGTTWSLLANTTKTNNTSCGGQGLWTSYSIVLPTSANNNANVKIGFNWTNNDDGVGTDPSFAVDNVTLSITLNSPVANFSANNTNFCQGTCISFTDLSTNTPTSWSWSFPGASPNNANIQNPTNICYNSSGTYNVTLTATNANGSNSYTKSLYITVNGNPSVSITLNPVTICTGNSVTLTASGATNYTWSPATGLSATSGNSVTANPSNTTVYTIIGTTGLCTDTITDTVYVTSSIVANAGIDDTICKGSSAILNSSGGTQYLWSPATGLSCTTCQSPTATPLVTTTYTVTVSDGTCLPDTDQVTIVVRALPTPAAANNSPICEGNTLNLTAGGGTTYAWAGPSGFTSTLQNPMISNASTSNSGVYSVTATDNFGCAGTISTNVTINPNPIINISSNSPLCYGNNLLLNSNGGSSYLWSGPNGFTSTDQNPIILAAGTSNAGTYSVTVTNTYSCTSTDNTSVNISTKITITTPAILHLCPGTSTNITAIATGGTNPLNYYWNGILSSATTIINPQTNTVLSVYAVDANNCISDTNFVTITVYPLVNIDLYTSNDSICPGASAIISANISQGNGGPYLVYMQDGTVIVPPVTVNPLVTTDYIIFVKDGCGTTDADTARVKVSYVPSTYFTSDLDDACVPSTVYFNQESVNSNCIYKWDFGDSGSDNLSYSANPVHIYNTPGIFSVSLTIATPNGCLYTNTYNNMITIYPKPEAKFFAIPQVVSIINPQVKFDNLSTYGFYNFWTFGNGDSSSLENPSTLYDTNGTYITRLITESIHGCRDTAYDDISVIDEFTFYAPTAFTPNSDGINDTFCVKGNGIDTNNFQMYIFDRWGEIIYYTEKYDINYPSKYGWNGSVKYGRKGEIGIYTWYIIYKDIQNNKHEKSGSVVLID